MRLVMAAVVLSLSLLGAAAASAADRAVTAKSAAPAAKPAGATALERLAAKGWGVNQPGTNYFTSCYPYRNLMRLAVPSWDANDGSVDTANWLTDLPAGGQATTRITAS